MKNVVDISCFSSEKWLEMRVFDGLMGWDRLAWQTVDSYKYGRTFAGICALTCKMWSSSVALASMRQNSLRKKEKIYII